MKTALITTTINVPTVLQLYRKLDPNVAIFIAGDEKTPNEIWEFVSKIKTGFEECPCATGAFYYSVPHQKQLGYEHSELIGWNTDSRRNIALLETLKWGAEIIISVDDDMIPVGGEFDFNSRFEFPFDGLQLGTAGRWINTGFTMPETKQRGLPFDIQHVLAAAEPVVDAKIGVVQGIILGVPDTDAPTAMTNRPFIHSASDILRNGFVVHPQAYAVFNSQITAFRAELAPAFAQFYAHQGRNTDIFASMLMRRIMQERNLYTYFGPPMGFHARQPRPLFNDLKAEMYGLEHIAEWADYLRRSPLPDVSVTEQCSILMNGCALFSNELKEVAAAFYRDCERVL